MSATFDEPQTSSSRAERAGDKDVIAGARPGALHSHPRRTLTYRDRIDHDMLVSTGSITTDQVHAVTSRKVQVTVVHPLGEVRLPNILRHANRYQRPERPGSHRCEIRK